MTLNLKKEVFGKKKFFRKKTRSKKPRCMNISVQQRGFFIFIFSSNASALSGRMKHYLFFSAFMITSKWLPLFSTTFFRKSEICWAVTDFTISR